MALDLTTENKKLGETNFQRVADHLTRRNFMKSMGVTGGVVAAVTPAAYFGYQATLGKPVKAALFGAGDEGGILVNDHNKEFLQFTSVCDIRPFNQRRIMDGEGDRSPRKGLKAVYKGEAKDIKIYTDYLELLEKEKDIEAVVIALPLHLHAPVAIDVMRFGQKRGKPIHVLCEKLMAWNIAECKKMIAVAKETGSILSIGHQRHYSLLYAHAVEVMEAGVLGDVKHIRALWHRNNSWPWEMPANSKELVSEKLARVPKYRDGWYGPVYQEDYVATKDKLKEYGYDSIEQLVRWRLYEQTGGGLMAELGSHQLDACSIFLGKVKPLSVTGVGGKFFYGDGRNDREVDDNVFVTYEFPGKNHPRGKHKGSDKNDVVVVTYSSISTNSFEKYGECVMGSRGSMVVEMESSLQLYIDPIPGKPTPPRTTDVSIAAATSTKPALEASSTWGTATAGPIAAGGPAGAAPAAVSRGYKEEMEDFAYCVRLWDAKLGYAKDENGKYKQRLPRCHGEVAMADAIIALTANQAMHKRQRIEFDLAWFDGDQKAVPDDANSVPKVKPRLG